ncbi:uncharacterized protein LOC110456933 [Mizuhopecten yessoensis]|uniref:uncharacterized protein LOC110456933 n=1 Tax=Mizuhopecten yessoensis TaxID=6573 RepID=UPI000B45D79D|nr:uncharacterized protein LOC110456933 [Mizuhopecten yessoensis]
MKRACANLDYMSSAEKKHAANLKCSVIPKFKQQSVDVRYKNIQHCCESESGLQEDLVPENLSFLAVRSRGGQVVEASAILLPLALHHWVEAYGGKSPGTDRKSVVFLGELQLHPSPNPGTSLNDHSC